MTNLRYIVPKSALCTIKKKPGFIYQTDCKMRLYVYKDIKLNNENTLRAILKDMGSSVKPNDKYHMIEAINEYFIYE